MDIKNYLIFIIAASDGTGTPAVIRAQCIRIYTTIVLGPLGAMEVVTEYRSAIFKEHRSSIFKEHRSSIFKEHWSAIYKEHRFTFIYSCGTKWMITA
jgi:hypothetical protein